MTIVNPQRMKPILGASTDILLGVAGTACDLSLVSFCSLIVAAAYFVQNRDSYFWPALSIGLLGLAFRAWFKRRQRRQHDKDRLRESLLKTIVERYPYLGYSRIFSQCADSLLLSIGIGLSILVICFCGGLCGAIVAECSHAYEAAELIYRVVPTPDKDNSSMAAAQVGHANKKSYHAVDQGQIRALAAVYGAESSQMARLLFAAGSVCQQDGDRHKYYTEITPDAQKRHLERYLVAEQWFAKSLAINELLKSDAGYAENLSEIAYCQFMAQKKDASARSAREALAFIKGHPEMEMVNCGTLYDLEEVARNTKNVEQDRKFLDRAFHKSIDKEAADDARLNKQSERPASLFVQIVFVALCLKLAAVLSLAIRDWQLDKLAARLKRSAEHSIETPAVIIALDLLTTLELYRRNYSASDAYSLRLLNVVSNSKLD